MSFNWRVTFAAPSTKILCCYVNYTHELQIIQITENGNISSEKVIFPQERILFESMPEGQLKIYTKKAVAQIIPCQKLQVEEVRQNQTVAKTIAL